MQLHELQTQNKSKGRRRVARGGKRGTYSGRGLKGQKSRAGRRIRPALRDLISRLPKRRGFKNKPLKSKPLILKMKALAGLTGEVDLSRLKKEGLVPNRYRGEVKIVGPAIDKPKFVVKELKMSESVKIKFKEG